MNWDLKIIRKWFLMNKLRIKAHIEHVKTDQGVTDDEIAGGSSFDILNKNGKNYQEVKENDDDDEEEEPQPEEAVDATREISEFARKKIIKYRRVGKTIEKYSKNAKLCLLTMPYPRKKFAWWEYSHIIHDLTPKNVTTMFVRGTQEQVLTYQF